MMKKTAALLLALVMMVLTGSALADDGFVIMLNTLVDDEVLGQPGYFNVFEDSGDDKKCTVYFNFPENQIALAGENEGTMYIAVWAVDSGTVFSLLHSVCVNYGMLSEKCEYGLRIAWRLSASEGFTPTEDEEGAAKLAEILEAALQSVYANGTQASVEAGAGTVEAGVE